MAKAVKFVISSTLSLERVRAIRSSNGRRLPVSATSFRKETLPLTRFELGSPVLRYSPGDKFLRGALYVRICSSKGQHSTDDGSPSCNSPSLPPNGPSRTSDVVDSPDCADAARMQLLLTLPASQRRPGCSSRQFWVWSLQFSMWFGLIQKQAMGVSILMQSLRSLVAMRW